MQSKDQLESGSQSLIAWPPSVLRLLIGAAITAGLGYLIVQTLYGLFVVPEEIVNFPEQSPRWMYERLDIVKNQVEEKNLMLIFGIVGAIFGVSSVLLSFGARAGKALIIALLASAALGILGAAMSNEMFHRIRATSGKDVVLMGITLDAMKQAIVGYALLWGLIGLGTGVGIGSVRGAGKALVAGISGLLGGVLGAMLYVILTAQFMVGVTMNRVLPYNLSGQAMWLALFLLVVALCIGLGTGEKRPRQAA